LKSGRISKGRRKYNPFSGVFKRGEGRGIGTGSQMGEIGGVENV